MKVPRAPPPSFPPIAPPAAALLHRGYIPAALAPLALLLGPGDMAVLAALGKVASPAGDGFVTAPAPPSSNDDDAVSKETQRREEGGLLTTYTRFPPNHRTALQWTPEARGAEARRHTEFMSHALSSRAVRALLAEEDALQQVRAPVR